MLCHHGFVFVPDIGNARIPRHHSHQSGRLLNVCIQRQHRQNSVQKLCRGQAVRADDNGVLSHALRGKVPVGDDELIAVPHFTENLQQLRAENFRNIFQHCGLLPLP